jgi:uncharacterized protein (DUF736 family)
MENQKNIPLKDKSIGAFWEKISKSGNKYYSGNIMLNGQKYFLAMFTNNRKSSDRQPDFNIFLSEKKENN